VEALAIASGINRRAGFLPKDEPGAKILKNDARRIENAVDLFLANLEKDPESVKHAGPRLYELEQVFGFWMLRMSAYKRLLDLKNRIAGRGFSCALDKIVFTYLSLFCPFADYVRLEAALAIRAKTIDTALEGVAAGDYNSAAAFSEAGKPIMKNILEAEAEAARLEAYSRFNRRLQFVFWDVFFNPFGLEPGPKGICAENRFSCQV
jgi:hypothetical protein